MSPRVLLYLTILGAMAGCRDGATSGSSTSSSGECGGGTPTTQRCAPETGARTPGRAAFARELLRVRCERDLRCLACAGCGNVPETCRQHDNATWGYPTAEETVHDATCAQACLDALANAPCSEGYPAPCVEAEARVGPPPPADGLSAGQPCAGGVCGQGTYCEVRESAGGGSTMASPCPVCRSMIQDGQACPTFNSPGCLGQCASGGPGGYCRHPSKLVGESCAANENCFSSFCLNGTCAASPAQSQCSPTPPPDGAACDPFSPNCHRGSVCVMGANGNVCTAALPAGQLCTPAQGRVACQGVCVANSGSSGGTCVTPQAAPTDGQPCGQSRYGLACAPGHLPVSDPNGCTCRRQRIDGETCASDLDCKNLCIRGTCATRQLNGQPCVDGQDCVSAVCTAGVCAAACSGAGSSSSGG